MYPQIQNSCSILGCYNHIHKRQWCLIHYTRWMQHRDPLIAIRPNDTLIERCARKIVIDFGTGCWNWIGSCDNKGYGRVGNHIGSGLSHRTMYELHRESIPLDLQIDHLCQNTGCVNPYHMEIVDNATNYSRRIRKTHCPQGHPYSILNTYNRPSSPEIRRCRICRQKEGILYRKKVKNG